MKIHIALIIILFTFLGCNQKPTNDLPIESITSEAVFEKQSIANDLLSSGKGRYRVDIVSELYEEALSKNKTLYEINEAIKEIEHTKNDSLEHYFDYAAITESYKDDTDSYIYRIQDTILRKMVQDSFNDMNKVQNNRIADYENKRNILDKKTAILQDRLILMKLFVTQSMMIKYQENQKPNIASLEELIKDYDTLIVETKQFINLEGLE